MLADAEESRTSKNGSSYTIVRQAAMNGQGKDNIRFADKVGQWIINAIGVLCVFSGMAILCFQVFVYLKDGEWIEFPLSILFAFGPEGFLMWLNNPRSWFGLHKIINGVLEVMPLSLFFMIVGVTMAGYEVEKGNA